MRVRPSFVLIVLHLLLALGACRPPTPATTHAAPADLPRGRLPRAVEPQAYRLELTIDPARESFSGRTIIAVQLTRPSDHIWLHGQQLQVERASVSAAGRVHAARYEQLDVTGVARLQLDGTLPAGPAQIEVVYRAPFHDGLAGLYAVESEGVRHAFTQFEPLEARRAFPCFDEPAFKTPFDIELTVPAGLVAVTNTPEIARQPGADGMSRRRFATTRPLPTYLIGLSVGDFDVVEAVPIPPSPQRATPLPLRGIAVRGKGAQLAYALAHTGPLLIELERYYDIAYPYAKLDLIAVPDFGAGAMENAAAITFREWLLLLDADAASEGQRRGFASVMAHELAHHWFGNLVTMPWWDDIWLNEGFATWSAARTVEAVHPEHQAWVSLAGSVQRVMDLDGRVSARTVRQPVPTNADMGNAFDGITYQKGAGILRMFERYLGEEVFRAGVQTYLRERAFGVGASADLLETLARVAGDRVVGSDALAAAFNDFLEKPGVPLVEVEPRCEPAAEAGGSAVLSLRQSRYLPLGSAGSRDQHWRLPLCVRYGSGDGVAEKCTLLTAPTGELGLSGGCPDWVLPNAAGAGYYIGSLDSAWLTRLCDRGYGQLDVNERLSLAHSLEAAVHGGSLDIGDLLALLPTLAADPARLVALSPTSVVVDVRDDLAPPELHPKLRAFARSLYAERFAALGYAEREGEGGDARLLRGHLAHFLAEVARDPTVRAELARLGQVYLGPAGVPLQPDGVAADLRGTALAVALEDGPTELYDRALAKLHATDDAAERGHLLGALSSVTRAQQSERALSLTLDPKLKLAEVLTPLAGQFADARTRDRALAYMKTHYDAIVKRGTPTRMGRLPLLAAGYCDQDNARELREFFATRIDALGGGPRNLESAVERIELCAAFRARQTDSARAFLEAL